jgi:hypothetical protein
MDVGCGIGDVFHDQMNGPAWPEAQPWENSIFALVAIIVVLLNRRTMMRRGHATTDVLMPGNGGKPDQTQEAVFSPQPV